MEPATYAETLNYFQTSDLLEKYEVYYNSLQCQTGCYPPPYVSVAGY